MIRVRQYTDPVLTDQQLMALSPAERSDLSRRLAELVAPGPVPEPAMARGRHRFVVLLTVSCAVLVPWIIFLAATLPHRYIASHWTLTWVGFDLALLASLAGTAVLAWLGRQVMIVACFVTATLLVCDAWFDITTSSTWRDTAFSIADAALIELPLAGLLVWVGFKLMRFAVLRASRLSGIDATSLLEVPLLGLPVLASGPDQNAR
jgi:hypothetical protein